MPIIKRQISSDNKEKLACARCFLQWYSQQQGAEYSLVETEEVFPKLNGNIRWDFVATPTSGATERGLVLEVKRVTLSKTLRQRAQWHRVLGQVFENLGQTLKGKFMVTPIRLNPPKGKRFVDRLTDVIRENIASMKVHETVGMGRDLGQQILEKFPSWPLRLRNGGKVACEFYLLKTADVGHSIELGGGSAHWLEEATMEAIVPKLSKASLQLRLAREKGFEQTFLLLDLKSEFPWSPEIVRKVLVKRGFSSPDVSKMYLVQVSPPQIAEVWTAG